MDEQVVGGGGGSNTEKPSEYAPPQTDTKTDDRPISERIVDKSWKARTSAYEDLKKYIKATLGEDQLFSEYGKPFNVTYTNHRSPNQRIYSISASFLPKMTNDAHPGALDTGLETALLFVDTDPSLRFKDHVEKIATTTIDKSFGGRSQEKGKALLLKMMEVDDCNSIAPILISKLNDKKPKIPPACLEVLKEGIIAFGAKAFPVKEIIASFRPVLDGSNAAARELVLSLMVEMVKWIGKAPLSSLVENLRPAQKSDFEKLLTETETERSMKPKPTLYLRKDRPSGNVGTPSKDAMSMSGNTAAVTQDDTGGGSVGNDDGREYVESIDLMKKLKGTEYATHLTSEKWEPQLKAMQLIIDELTPVAKIAKGSDLSEILQTIKTNFRQGHITVQVASLKVLGLLADGARSDFTGSARSVSQMIILKCKEKKLCQELTATLKMFLKHCLGYESFHDDFNEQIRSKKVAVHGRLCLIDFILTVVNEFHAKITTDHLKPLVELMIFACEDSDPKIRDACISVMVSLGPVIKNRGRSALEAHKLLTGLEQTNARVFKKIKAAMDGTASESSAAVPSSEPSTISVTSGASGALKDGEAPAAAVPVVKKSSKSSSVASTATTKKAGSKAVSTLPSNDDEEDLSLSLESATEQLRGLGIEGWEDKFQELMKSEKWTERVEALVLLGNAIKSQQAGGQYSSALVVYMYETFSKFKVSNINIIKAVIQVVQVAAEFVGDDKFSKPAAWVLLKEFGDRLSDKKISPVVISLLTTLSEALSPTFVCKCMKKVMDKTKAPVAHQIYLEWIKNAIAEFGANAFAIQAICAFCTVEVENRDAKVRGAAIEVFGALFNQIGSKLQPIVFHDDMKPALRSLIEAEFAKVGHNPSLKVTRVVKGGSDEDKGSAAGDGGIARQDITTMLEKTFLKDINLVDGKESWKKRKEAIEAVIAACERSGFYLDATKGTVEIAKALKARLSDTNANLKPLAAAAIANIIASLEPDNGAKLLRAVAGALVSTLGDNKQQMRTATISSLQMIVTLGNANGAVNALLLNVLVPFLGEILGANPVGRSDNLAWLNQHVDLISGKGNKDENVAADLTVACINAMQDKIASVRSSSEQLLTALMARGIVTRGMLEKATRDLPTATKRSLQCSLDRMNSAFGTKKSVTDNSSAAVSATALSSDKSKPVNVEASSPKRPSASASAAAAASVAIPAAFDGFAFKKCNKSKRCEEFQKLHWPSPPEDVTESEMNVLKSQWDCLLYSEADLSGLLFPVTKKGAFLNQDSLSDAISELTKQLEGPNAMDHSDFILRWATWALSVRETASGMMKVLQFITSVFETMLKKEEKIHEAELAIILPHLIDKSGHKSERHKAAFIACLRSAGEIVSPNKLCQYLLQGLQCKNKKTRVVCIEEIQYVVEGAGAGALGRAGVKEIGSYLDSKDNDVAGRHACLELAYTLYVSLSSDQTKLMKLLGDVSEKSQTMVEERIRQKLKSNPLEPSSQKTASVPSVTAPEAPSSNVHSTPKRTSKIPVVASPPNSASPDLLDGSPFRLEITPPGTDEKVPNLQIAECDSPILNGLKSNQGSVMLAVGEPAGALTPKVSTLDKLETAIEAGSDTELDGIYVDIASKLQALVDVNESVSELNELHDDAREYLKMLHLVVTGAWAKETLPEDEEAVSRQAEPMVSLLLQCLDRSFRYPSITSIQQQQLLGIDLSLSSLALANLYAYVSREDVVIALSEDCIMSIFGNCIERMIDSKLKHTSEGGGSSSTGAVDLIDDGDFGFTRSVADLTMVDTANQLTRALNILVLQLAQQAPVATVFASLLRLIKGCIPEISDSSSFKKIAKPGSKVISRLILRVVSDEVSKINSFQREKTMLKHILHSLHRFFDGHPEITADEIPFCTAKTLLDQVMKSVGGEKVASTINMLSLVTEMNYHVPKNSLLSKLVSNYLAAKNSSSIGSGDGSSDHQDMVNIIDDITNARDKSIPIRKLHELISANPDIDVHAYLQRISSAFRKFVLDALTKLDDGKALQLSAERAAARPTVITVPGNVVLDGAVSTTVPTNNETATFANSTSNGPNTTNMSSINDVSGGSEAMRIIEGLRQKASSSTTNSTENNDQPSSGPITSQSLDATSLNRPLARVTENTIQRNVLSRAQMNEKVRTSLNNLTSSLDLSSTTSSTSSCGDDDLAARLDRLRSITKSAPAGTATISPPSTEINDEN